MTGENIAVTGYRMDPALLPGAQPMVIGRADDAGVPVWLQGVDLPGADFGHAIIETANTDLATAGYTLDPATGLLDMMLTRFTRAGAPVYVRTVGTPGFSDYAFSLAEDPTDDGLVVTGWSDSFTPGYALTLFKMTPAGAMTWGFVYGGAPGPAFADRGTYVTRLFDGGWAVAGWTKTLAAAGAFQDLLLMRVTPAGAIAWVRSLGYGVTAGPTETEGRCVVETPDGGIVVVGQTGVAGAVGTREILVAKFTPGGGLIWAETVGGPLEDFAHSVALTDAGFAVAGYSVGPAFGEQAIVIGFDGLGTPLWNETIGLAGFEEFRSVALAGDGRLFLTGRGAAFGPGATNLIYGAVDPTGAGCLGAAVPLAVGFPPPIVTIQPIVSAPFLAPIVPAAAIVGPLPTLSTPVCSVPSVLVPYVNSYTEAPNTFTASAIAPGLGTAGAMAGTVNFPGGGGIVNWAIMRFDPLGNARWAKSYTAGGVESGVGIARALQGWWSVARTQTGIAAPTYPLLMKVDDDGFVLMRRRIGGVEAWPTGVIETSDRGAAVVGFTMPAGGVNMKVFLSKFSQALVHEWTATLGSATRVDQGFSVIQASDGGYVIAGMDQDITGGGSPPELLVAKLSAAGALLWARALQLGAGQSGYGTAITETASGNYAVAGYDIDVGTGETNGLIAEFTAAGAFVWLTQMQDADLDRVTGIVARGDSLILCGYSSAYAPGQEAVIAKTNPAGDVLWMRAVFEPGSYTADAVTVSDGGEILVAGSSVIAGASGLVVGKFNALGASCLGLGYTPFFTHPANTFFDPGLTGALEARTITSPFILDADETLTLTNCPAPLVAVGDPAPLPRMFRALELEVTSPASGTLECRITASRPMTLRMSIFDLHGRHVGSSIPLGELKAGPNVIRLPLAGLARGVYTAVAEGGIASAKAKFIFLRD